MDYGMHDELIKIMNKLSSKDPALYNSILNKIDEIVNNEFLDHYKNLKKPLQHFKRVHITEQFVLIFEVDKQNNRIVFRYFEHRDKIYEKTYD
jgi:YafQ family addiction module toxin component